MSDRPIIAIADDNPGAREILEALLGAEYDLRVFDSGPALLDGLHSGPVDLVLLDVAMPSLDGYQTCRALRADRSNRVMPVIFLSAHGQPEDRLKGYAAGGNDYVVKPYDHDELLAKIRLAIDNLRQSRRLALEVAELSHAATLTADMLGEAGLVLDFQRELAGCSAPDQIAGAILQALGRFGLEGCIRLESGGSALAVSVAGRASALECSLLEHLSQQQGARIQTMGQSLCFAFGALTVLVRGMAWVAAPGTPETVDAMGRARDNIALVVEGAVARLRALDSEDEARQLAGANTLIATTRQALRDLESIEHAVHQELDAVFEALRDEFEMRFPQLGLTAAQEDSLADILLRHRSRGLAVLDRGRAAASRLHGLVEQLERLPARAAPA